MMKHTSLLCLTLAATAALWWPRDLASADDPPVVNKTAHVPAADSSNGARVDSEGARKHSSKKITFRFSGPKDARISIHDGQPNSSVSYVEVPGEVSLVAGRDYELEISGLPEFEETVIARLHVFGTGEGQDLKEGINIRITPEDLNQLSNDQRFTRAFYLPNSRDSDGSRAVRVLDQSVLGREFSLIKTVADLGEIVAGLFIVSPNAPVPHHRLVSTRFPDEMLFVLKRRSDLIAVAEKLDAAGMKTEADEMRKLASAEKRKWYEFHAKAYSPFDHVSRAKSTPKQTPLEKPAQIELPKPRDIPAVRRTVPDREHELKELRQDVKRLHDDVKRLIKLLEKKPDAANAAGPAAGLWRSFLQGLSKPNENSEARDRDNDVEARLERPEPVVLVFDATWCGPCRQIRPIVERLAREGLPFRRVDVDRERRLVQRFNVKSIPAFILVKNGQETSRITGMTSESQLRRLVAVAQKSVNQR